jgi:hypothetical protein
MTCLGFLSTGNWRISVRCSSPSSIIPLTNDTDNAGYVLSRGDVSNNAKVTIELPVRRTSPVAHFKSLAIIWTTSFTSAFSHWLS